MIDIKNNIYKDVIEFEVQSNSVYKFDYYVEKLDYAFASCSCLEFEINKPDTLTIQYTSSSLDKETFIEKLIRIYTKNSKSPFLIKLQINVIPFHS